MFDNSQQVVHVRAIDRVVAAISQPDNTIRIDDKISAELCRVAVFGQELSPGGKQFRVCPECLGRPRAPDRAFKLVRAVHASGGVKQHFERIACILHPLLDSRQCSERDDKNARVQAHKIVLALAQLCSMFAAGQSTQVPQKHEYCVVAGVEHFIQRALDAFCRLQVEFGGGMSVFEHGVRWLVSLFVGLLVCWFVGNNTIVLRRCGCVIFYFFRQFSKQLAYAHNWRVRSIMFPCLILHQMSSKSYLLSPTLLNWMLPRFKWLLVRLSGGIIRGGKLSLSKAMPAWGYTFSKMAGSECTKPRRMGVNKLSTF